MSTKENKEILINERDEQKIYELGFLIAPVVSDEKIIAEATSIRDVLEPSCNIISSEAPVLRDLEYDIDKVIGGKKHHFSKAYFGFFIFDTEAKNIEDVKNELEKNKNIIRFIIIVRTKDSLTSKKRKILPTVSKKTIGIGKQNIAVMEEKIDEKELDKTIDELVAD